MELEIKGTIIGQDEVKAMINAAPEVFTRHIRRSMNAVGVYFIGRKASTRKSGLHGTGRGSRAKVRNYNSKFLDTGKDGLIRSQFKNRHNINDRPYSPKFINTAFNYKLENAERIEMKLRAGTLYTEKKKIHEIAELLEQGGTIRSNKYMPVPIYQNFNKRLDQFKGYKGIIDYLFRQKRLAVAQKGGHLYYIDKQTGKILAVGMKSVTIKKQFEFYNKWSEAQPKIIGDLAISIDNACRDIQELN